MSAVNIYLAPDGAHVFTDGAAMDSAGRFALYDAKSLAVPHLGAVLASRSSCLSTARAVHYALASHFRDLESLLAGATEKARQVVEQYEARPGAPKTHLMLYIAAWSRTRGRAEAWTILDEWCAARDGVEPWTLLPVQGDAQISPGNNETAAEVSSRFRSGALGTVDGWADLMEYQREHMRVPRGDREARSIGGFIQRTVVSEAGIQQSILRRWPDDRLGEFLGEALEPETARAAPAPPQLTGADLSGTSDGSGNVTITIRSDDDATMAANSSDKLPTQAAVKAYVDAKLAGLSWKQSVRAATTANITLSGAQTIDGVSVVDGDRVLVKNQSTGSQNGIYVAASGSWTRATDADTGAELVNATVYVSEGSTLADTQWTCTTNATITVGSTSLTFAQSGAGGGSALTVRDEGSTLTAALTSLNFTGSGVHASSSGDDVVINIPGAGVPPITILQRTTAQSIANATEVAVSWSSAVTDPLGAWSSGSATIITVPTGYTGVEVQVSAAWGDNSAGNRWWRLKKGANNVSGHFHKAFDRSLNQATTRVLTVAAGDQLSLKVAQDSGGALNWYDSADASYTPTIQLRWFV